MYPLSDGIVIMCPLCNTLNVVLVTSDDWTAPRACCHCEAVVQIKSYFGGA
jgi:hypothetical protein